MYIALMERNSGLGELLRYLAELVDQGAEEVYQTMGLTYRARYTPVMRAVAAGADTVSEITEASRLTQGAISQTIGLMVSDGLLERHELADKRKTGVSLTRKGRMLLRKLVPHWEITYEAIGGLEAEIGYPLLDILEAAASALERQGFAGRLREIQKPHGGVVNGA